MNGLSWFNAPPIYLELSESRLSVLHGEDGLELGLERSPNGRLTPACSEQVSLALQGFLRRKNWQPRARAWCALNARGVTLRRLKLPPASDRELRRLLLLQIESEFPLSPEDLAWGFRPLTQSPRAPGPATAQQEVLVAAIRKEVLEDYSELLVKSGLSPAFTLAALARGYLCPANGLEYAALDIGPAHSELIVYQQGLPATVRVLNWGHECLIKFLAERLAISPQAAEDLTLARISLSDTGTALQVPSALEEGLQTLAGAIRRHWMGQKLYVSGPSAKLAELSITLARLLDGGAECVLLKPSTGRGRSAAILGLKTAAERNGSFSPLLLESKPAKGRAGLLQPMSKKWASWAAGLALLFFVLPYLQALALKPFLAYKLASLKTDRARLAIIDRELSFLRYLQASQSPYLDSLYVLAKAAPSGTRIESLSMNRRGELSWRGSFPSPQQVTDFRSKLIDSGLFASVAVEEQTPGPKLMVRMSAQWKPAASRGPIKIEPAATEPAKATSTEARSGPAPDAAVPPTMPKGAAPVRATPKP